MSNTPISMKAADPEQVTATMIEAIRKSIWFAGGPHYQFVPNLVRDIHAALVEIGVLMIQPDLP